MANDRRAEIEAKKAKLVEMRRMREERKAASQAEAAVRRVSEVASPTPSLAFRDVNDLVTSLIGPRSEAGVGTTPDLPSRSSFPPSPAGGRVPTPALGISNLSSSARESDAGSDRLAYGSAALSALAHDSPGAPFEPSPMRAPVDLVDGEQDLFEFPQKQKVMYNKEIQTADFSDDEDRPTENEMRQRIQREQDVERAAAREREMEEESIRMEQELEDEIREITEEERMNILSDPTFLDFVDQSSKMVQRALQDRYDYTRDYRISTDLASDDVEGEKVKRVCAFFDEKWTKNRSVTDVDWSHKFPELCVAAYNKNPSALNDPDGVVLVWNLHLLERPEFVFHAQSDVLSVAFSPYHSNLVFGGTYSGEILLWDTRHGKHLPVLKTTRSAAGHFYPVYNMQIVGTQNAHNLITADTDGTVCSWLVDMLAQPQETIHLTHSGHSKTDDVAVSALDFPPNETSTFYVGTEEGSVYQALRHDRAGVKAGLHNVDVYRSHRAPVTSLSCHRVQGAVDFSDLFLTASMDWKIKLWRGRAPAAGQVQLQQGQQPHEVQPLHTFEAADEPVYDVDWHPHHPALFGAVDGTGKFDLWNLNSDTDVPTVSTHLSDHALNKFTWEPKEGRRAAIGSADGRLHVVDIGELAVPREAEWTDMQRTVSGMPIMRDVPVFLEGEGRRVSTGFGGLDGGRSMGGYEGRRTSLYGM